MLGARRLDADRTGELVFLFKHLSGCTLGLRQRHVGPAHHGGSIEEEYTVQFHHLEQL